MYLICDVPVHSVIHCIAQGRSNINPKGLLAYVPVMIERNEQKHRISISNYIFGTDAPTIWMTLRIYIGYLMRHIGSVGHGRW